MNRSQWNQLGKVFQDEVCDIVRDETNDLMKGYVTAAKLPKGSAVLVDFGCGVGTFIHRFGSKFKSIVGVEFAATTIAQAKVLCADMKNVRWMTADIVSAAKDVGRVADLTVCLNVITSPSPQKRALLWKSLSNTTKAGGYTLLVLPSLESEDMVQAVISGKKKPKLATRDGLVVREEATQKFFEENELRAVLADYGFKVTKLGKAYFPWATEGVRETAARAKNRPWDWVCLAERV
jgi:2-polyprenyl-3-methyl-5-hydroxy-6-metoxy-1,4-benzoquinol methylase